MPLAIALMSEVLGTFEQAVLLAVFRFRSNAYGRAILKETQTRLQREVTAGAVYATLDRLEKKRLISSHLEQDTPVEILSLTLSFEPDAALRADPIQLRS